MNFYTKSYQFNKFASQNKLSLEDSSNMYFNIGFEHIYNIAALDHILFLVALCALFAFKDWRKLLILITAFTIGHSITLALAGLDIISINSRIVELLIPVTIMLTAIFNVHTLIKNKDAILNGTKTQYLLALIFGFIHGMGFSNYLRSTLFPGDSLILQLLFFNLGIELGQILIVLKLLLIGFFFTTIVKIKMNHWAFTLSGLAFAVSLYLLIAQL